MVKKIISSVSFSKNEWLATGIVFILMCGYYFFILNSRILTDVQHHAAIAHSFVVNNDKLTPNFLYFILVAAFTGFSSHYPLYYASSIFLLSSAIALKFAITLFNFKRYTSSSINTFYCLTAAIVMLFVFALPGIKSVISHNLFYGQIVANVWHNSTVIFLMPFALLLFFSSYKMLYTETASKNNFSYIVVLLIVNALIKPSFLFSLLPSVFAIIVFRIATGKYSFSKLLLFLPFVIAILLVGAEYVIIYKFNYISIASGTSNEKQK